MTLGKQDKNAIREVLTSEVKMIIGIIIFALGVVAPFYQMKQEIALIQKDISIINSNHIMHLEDLVKQQKDQQTQILELQKQIWIVVNKQ